MTLFGIPIIQYVGYIAAVVMFLAFLYAIRFLMYIKEVVAMSRRFDNEIKRCHPDDRNYWNKKKRSLWLRFLFCGDVFEKKQKRHHRHHHKHHRSGHTQHLVTVTDEGNRLIIDDGKYEDDTVTLEKLGGETELSHEHSHHSDGSNHHHHHHHKHHHHHHHHHHSDGEFGLEEIRDHYDYEPIIKQDEKTEDK